MRGCGRRRFLEFSELLMMWDAAADAGVWKAANAGNAASLRAATMVTVRGGG